MARKRTEKQLSMFNYANVQTRKVETGVQSGFNTRAKNRQTPVKLSKSEKRAQYRSKRKQMGASTG